MDCMRQDYIPQRVPLGSLPAGSVVAFPDYNGPYLVTNNNRIKQVEGGSVDTVGVVSCETGALFWFSDMHDATPIKDAVLVYSLEGKGVSEDD